MKRLVFLFAISIVSIKSYAQALYIDKGQLPATSAQGGVSSGGSDVVNVDLFTGIGSVNIPIYNYSADGLDLGISLSYAAKGIQVDQIASSIGLGWNLNAGGYITRQVNGVEDEASQIISDIQYANCLGASIIETEPTYYYKGILVDRGDGIAYESESDHFTAVFGGRQVDFAIDVNGNVSTNPHSALKIQMFVGDTVYTDNLPSGISADSTHRILTFVITDEKGNQFQFIRGDYQDAPSLGGGTYYPTQRWVLSKLTTFTGKVVTYTYNDYYVSYKQYNNDTVNENVAVPPSGDSQPFYWTGHLSHLSTIIYPDSTTVTFNMGNAAARCDITNLSRLASIAVSKSDGTLSNTITFKLNQSYFNSGIFTLSIDPTLTTAELPLGSGSSCQYISEIVSDDPFGFTSSAKARDELNLSFRLKLNSITKIGTNDSTEPYYTFTYDSMPLPSRLSVSQDWYGYFNNKSFVDSNSFLAVPVAVPLHVSMDGSDKYGVDKTPNVTYLKADILTTVTNGLGGETEIHYEAPPNLVDYVANPPDMMDTGTFDGLCVSYLKYSDGFEPDNSYTLNYDYEDAFRFFHGGYYSYPLLYSGPTSTVTQQRFTNHMVSPIDFFNGSNHGYNSVTVKKYGFDTGALSKTFYNFFNPDYLFDDTVGLGYTNVFPRTTMYQPALGLISEIDEYTGSSVSPIKQTLFTYSFYDYTPVQNTAIFQCLYEPPGGADIITPGVFIKYIGGVAGLAINGGYIDQTPLYGYSPPDTYTGPYPNAYLRNYSVFSPSAVRVASKVENVLLNSNETSNETDYTYDSYDQLSTESWTDSKGGTYTKQYLHNYDYGIESGDLYTNQTAALATILAMNSAGLQTVITQETRKDSGTYNPDEVLQFSQILPNYTTVSGVGITTLNSIASSTLQQAVPTTSFHPSVSGLAYNTNSFFHYDANVNDLSDVTQYDDHNNVLETSYNNDLRVASAIWDTRIGQPVAKVSNAHYSNIAYTSFEEPIVSAYGIADYNKGNWDYAPAYIEYSPSSGTPALTGKHYYQLSPVAGYNKIVSVHPLNTGTATSYLLSFWCDTLPYVSVNSVSVTMQLQARAGNWKLYTAYIPTTTYPVTLTASGSGDKIDELRLLPSTASMDTYTYEPLKGVSSHCDERNNIIYYHYDPFGHLKTTTDINGNILSLTKTVIQGNDN